MIVEKIRFELKVCVKMSKPKKKWAQGSRQGTQRAVKGVAFRQLWGQKWFLERKTRNENKEEWRKNVLNRRFAQK